MFSPSTVENRNNVRHHTFVPKTIIKPDVCGPCGKKIKFGKVAVKCKDCRGVCHPDCKDSLPLPCIPFINTPTQKRGIVSIYYLFNYRASGKLMISHTFIIAYNKKFISCSKMACTNV